MDDSYHSITLSVSSAIDAIATEKSDDSIGESDSVQTLAAGVYFSWAKLVGPAARPEDCEQMEQLIMGTKT